MKNNWVIILVVAAILIMGGVFFISSKSRQKGEITLSDQTIIEGSTSPEESRITEESSEEPKVNPSNLSSLGNSYKCTYTIENGLKVTTYVKNGKMRTEIPLEGGDANISLYRDDKVYQWSEKEKQGIFMSVEEAKKQPNTEVQDPDKYLEEIRIKYQLDCKNVDLADSLFIAPEDIQFQDLSQLLNR